tara:strand:+ start:1774 stop:2037 length:264 start_codon:yes stop_codon:yes gene_type:complete
MSEPIDVRKWWPQIKRRACEIVSEQALRERQETKKLLKELEDIRTSLVVHGTANANEWILDIAYRLYDAIETHKEELNLETNNEDSN